MYSLFTSLEDPSIHLFLFPFTWIDFTDTAWFSSSFPLFILANVSCYSRLLDGSATLVCDDLELACSVATAQLFLAQVCTEPNVPGSIGSSRGVPNTSIVIDRSIDAINKNEGRLLILKFRKNSADSILVLGRWTTNLCFGVWMWTMWPMWGTVWEQGYEDYCDPFRLLYNQSCTYIFFRKPNTFKTKPC